MAVPKILRRVLSDVTMVTMMGAVAGFSAGYLHSRNITPTKQEINEYEGRLRNFTEMLKTRGLPVEDITRKTIERAIYEAGVKDLDEFEKLLSKSPGQRIRVMENVDKAANFELNSYLRKHPAFLKANPDLDSELKGLEKISKKVRAVKGGYAAEQQRIALNWAAAGGMAGLMGASALTRIKRRKLFSHRRK